MIQGKQVARASANSPGRGFVPVEEGLGMEDRSGPAEWWPENRICPHVPGGSWNHAPIATASQDYVHCPCCGGGGCCEKGDDLSDPMICPACGVPAVKGESKYLRTVS